MNLIFFDTEFTGLHQATTLMSIGLVDTFGDTFYAELTDYAQDQVNDWIREHVLANFTLGDQPEGELVRRDDDLSLCRALTLRGNRAQVRAALAEWLTNSETRKGPVQLWSDCLAYDWVLLNALLADYSNGYPSLPAGVHYIPMDLATLFQLKGVDPDVSRVEFADLGPGLVAHNAIDDALLIQRCYYKLQEIGASEVVLRDTGPVVLHVVRDGSKPGAKGIASFQIPGKALVDVLQAGCAHYTTGEPIQTSFTFQNW